MPIWGDYEPSANKLVAEQVEIYERSGGTRATKIRGYPCIVLWTRGRHSGRIRKTPLIKVEHDGAYVAVGSVGGADQHPGWFHNLLREPSVTVQDGPALFDAEARILEGGERDSWWQIAVATFPNYADYQQNTARRIPVVILESEAGAGPVPPARDSTPPTAVS